VAQLSHPVELASLLVGRANLPLAPPTLGLQLHLATRTAPSSLSPPYLTSSRLATRTAPSLHSHLYQTSRLRTRTVLSSHSQLYRTSSRLATRTAQNLHSLLYQTNRQRIRTVQSSHSHLYRTSKLLATRTAQNSVSQPYQASSSSTGQCRPTNHFHLNSRCLKPHPHLHRPRLIPWLLCPEMCPRLQSPPPSLQWLLPINPAGFLQDCLHCYPTTTIRKILPHLRLRACLDVRRPLLLLL